MEISMKISTKGRYALSLMLDIAQYSNGRPVSVKEIALRQKISDKYLEQIISVLNNAGYVKSVRGSRGGYLLSKPPEEYTIGMILRLTEGSLAPVFCIEEDAEPCGRMTECPTVPVWKKINEAINGVIDNMTLADLMENPQNNHDRKYDAVIFDLDGTLLDTLGDLTDAVNYIMKKYGYDERTPGEVRSFVGNGIRRLVERCLPDGSDTPNFDKIFDDYKEYYTNNCLIKTAPYDGIEKMLEKLRSMGYKLAIVSNKNQAAVKELCDAFFSKYISTAIGVGEKVRPKPSPDSTLAALKKMDCPKERAIYVGDSQVDLETAKNCGLKCISVSWGFRDKEILKPLNPYAIIDKPDEIFEVLR